MMYTGFLEKKVSLLIELLVGIILRISTRLDNNYTFNDVNDKIVQYRSNHNNIMSVCKICIILYQVARWFCDVPVQCDLIGWFIIKMI